MYFNTEFFFVDNSEQVHRAHRNERWGVLLPVEEPQYAGTGGFYNYFTNIS